MNSLRCSAQLLDFAGCPALNWQPQAATSLSRDKSSGLEVSEFGKSSVMNGLPRPAQLPDFAGCPALSW
ncbi:MAG: hypothetical protein D3922_06980 [Candidatus Electrothrix sp. AR1]|nr:hypothetical protein [Candidatus Electrothrix sp. AR1]